MFLIIMESECAVEIISLMISQISLILYFLGEGQTVKIQKTHKCVQ